MREMKYVLSISKAFSHGNHINNHTSRKCWRMNYIDKQGHVRTQKVNFLEAIFYKSGLYKRRAFVCLRCGGKFLGLARKEIKIYSCPYCSGK